jgi:hypothetical protein
LFSRILVTGDVQENPREAGFAEVRELLTDTDYWC